MDNLTIVVPFWNGHSSIARLLNSIPGNINVIVVDDHSDVSLSLDRENVSVYRPREKGYFSGAVNFGIDNCDTDVLVLNQDTALYGERWLEILSSNREKYAMIGERIAGEHPAWPNGYIHGTFMFIRRDAWKEVGPLNVVDYPLWGSTCEWQLRAYRKGYRALPLRIVPGFKHERGKKAYGSSISTLLDRKPELKSLMIRTPPAISVVINCYNHGDYLADAVHSLISGPTTLGHHEGQSFQSFEIIIVDDGSTDNTPEVGRALADRWAGVRYIHQNNRGSAAACNTGIKNSWGKYIAPLDSDDMMAPDRLELMYRAAINNPHSVVFDDLLTFDQSGIHKTPAGKPKVWRMPTYDFDKIVWKNSMHKGLLYPKAAWKEVGGYPEIMNKGREDWAFNVALGVKGWCGVKVDNPGYLYRRSGQNRTLINTTPTWRNHFLSQLKSLFPDIYQGRYPMGCCGSKSSSTSSKSNTMTGSKKMSLPGQDGMITVEYNGLNIGNVSYWGPVTKTRYIFGGKRRYGYIDSRDAPEMFNIYEGGRQVFAQVVSQPAQDLPAKQEVVEYIPADNPVSDSILLVEEDVEETAEEEPVKDPAEMTIAELSDYVLSLSEDQITALLDLELGGKARIGAVQLLESYLEQP